MSIAIHGLFWWTLQSTEKREISFKQSKIEIQTSRLSLINIEFIDSLENKEPSPSKTQNTQLEPKQKKWALKDLLAKPLLTQYAPREIGANEKTEHSNHGPDRTASGYRESRRIEQITEQTPFLIKLHAHIDSYLTYPHDLVLFRREGTVIVELSFDSQGPLKKEPAVTVTQSTDPILKVHILKTLDQALASSRLPLETGGSKGLIVSLNFYFRLIQPNSRPASMRKIIDTSLSFARSAESTSIGELWHHEGTRKFGLNFNLLSLWRDYKDQQKRRRSHKTGLNPLDHYQQDPRY